MPSMDMFLGGGVGGLGTREGVWPAIIRLLGGGGERVIVRPGVIGISSTLNPSASVKVTALALRDSLLGSCIDCGAPSLRIDNGREFSPSVMVGKTWFPMTAREEGETMPALEGDMTGDLAGL